MQRRRRVEDDVALRQSLGRRSDDLAVLVEWAESGEDVGSDLARALDDLQREVEAAETKKMLGGEYDRANAIVTIHPGAGGTESQDWARCCCACTSSGPSAAGFRREVMDYSAGDEAGIKSATVSVTGEYAYGLLLGRSRRPSLVRISPFDQAARRHTSFASVFVWPELPEMADIEIETRTCAWTPTDRAARAGSTSTSPIPPSASRTCRPASSSRARTSARSTRTARRR
jgi:peptide chain release factor 2